MSLTQVSISIGYRLGRALLRGVIVGLLSSGNSVAEDRNLIWTPSPLQIDSTSIPLPVGEKDVDKITFETGFTAEELQETIQALELVATFDLCSLTKKQTQMIEEQLRQLQQKQSAPYQLTPTQLQPLRATFSGLSQAQLATINQGLMNEKAENPARLNWHKSRDNSQAQQQTSANNLSEASSRKTNKITSSESTPEQGAESLSASLLSYLSSSRNKDSEALPTANFAQNEVDGSSREELIEQLSVPEPNLEKITVVTERGAPAIGIGVPTGFGATQGQFFTGLVFLGTTRLGPKADAGFSFGLGLGDPEESIGVDLIYTSISTIRSTPFDTGSTSIKIHRRLGETNSAAIGVENFIRYGELDADINYYGSLTNLFALRKNPSDLFNSLAITVGIGSGRFRELDDIREDEETINVFGSVGLRVSKQFSLVGAYTGNTIRLGASVAPFRKIPLVITPSVTDLTGEFDPRFILTIGYGTSLF